MSESVIWPPDRLRRFWALQKAARRAGLKLTADGDALHLRDDLGEGEHAVADLDEAETAIVTAEEGRVAK